MKNGWRYSAKKFRWERWFGGRLEQWIHEEAAHLYAETRKHRT